MASYDLKAILGEKIKRLTDKTLKALIDCMCTVGASLCSLDKRVSALESVELPEGGYKPVQEPVASPSASGTAVQFIESVSQDATGRMTATKKTVRTGSTSQTGVLQLEDSHTSTSTSKAATPKNVKEAYDLANSKVSHFVRDFNAQSGAPTAVSDWDDMDATGLYEIAGSPAAGTGHSPEIGVMTLLTIEPSSGFKVQLAMGYKTYRRYYHKVSSNPDAFEWTTWETLESQANKTTFIREYDSALDPASDDRYPSERAVAQQLYGVGNKPMLHAEGYYNLSNGPTTWRNVGLYVNDSDTSVAQPNIYGPEGDRTGRLTGGLDSLLHETGWEPYTDFGCLDYTAIFDMDITSTIDLDLRMANIIAHGIRKFKYRFFNYGQGLVRVRFCYSKTGGTYDNGLEIFTQEGESTQKYYQVNVPASRYAEAEVVIPSTIHAETNSWAALMRVTNGVT